MPLYDKARLLHIQEAIAYTEQFLAGRQKQDLYDDAQLRFAIERQLEIIGEATNHLSKTLTDQRPDVPWRKIVAFRNLITHEYFGIDLELIWLITQQNLPPLKVVIEQLIAAVSDQSTENQP